MRPIAPRAHRKTALPAGDTLVVEILSFLGDEPDRLDGFLDSSGLAIEELRTASAMPSFAEALLDHLCANEHLLVAFAESRDYDPAAIEARRRKLGYTGED